MHINVDFNDVKTVMQDSGVAIMGSAIASGEKRALKAVEQALNSPLLNDNDISGARHVLLNIMSGSDDIDMDEFGEITDFIQEAAGGTAELITGYGTDASLGDNVSVTIIATGFKSKQSTGFESPLFKERKVVNLDEKTEVKPVEEVKQINIVDEIQKSEPFVFIKDEVQEQPKNEMPPVVTAITEEKTVDFTISTVNDVTSVSEETTTEITEFTFNELKDEFVKTTTTEKVEIVNESGDVVSREEQIKLAQERIRKLKEITLKMKSPEGLAALEKQTAFERKNISLENKTPSTESNVSRYTLSEGDDKKIEIRPNNSFLHDNVD
jgi:cell division protein FtsZ